MRSFFASVLYVVAFTSLACLVWGCSREEHVSRDIPVTTAQPLAPTGKLRIVQAPAGTTDVPTIIKAERERAAKEKRVVLLYVGATWCEPCQRFHRAAERGDLDRDFPNLTLVEFDRDRDDARLDAAGYTSQYIPLFAAPAPDGRASGRYIEGSIKGEGAVAEIAPRLRELIAQMR